MKIKASMLTRGFDNKRQSIMSRKKVIIIGGGFGGINAALALRKAEIEVLVIDKTNHHLFQPLLYQVATAAIADTNIATPIREVLKNQKNASVIMADVVAIDKQQQIVRLLNGEALHYDDLIVATGATHSYFGNEKWEAYAPGLKTLVDAVKIREHILLSFETAEKYGHQQDIRKYLRFIVIGGGPTGVEMAGAIAEIAHASMVKNFRNIHPEKSEIYLIEGLDHLLPSYPMELSIQAYKDLEKMGIKVLLNTRVTNITEQGVYMGDTFIETANVIWAAGNEASSLLKSLAIPLDKQGRAWVEPDLTIPGFSNVFVIGDAAAVKDPNKGTLPGVAPVAIQQGKYVAKVIGKRIAPDQRIPFKYFDKGSMATIGKAKAVAVVGRFCFSGLLAWLAWSFIHIAYLISFRNRFIVMSQWIFWYLTNKRNVCIITRSIEEVQNEPRKNARL